LASGYQLFSGPAGSGRFQPTTGSPLGQTTESQTGQGLTDFPRPTVSPRVPALFGSRYQGTLVPDKRLRIPSITSTTGPSSNSGRGGSSSHLWPGGKISTQSQTKLPSFIPLFVVSSVCSLPPPCPRPARTVLPPKTRLKRGPRSPPSSHLPVGTSRVA